MSGNKVSLGLGVLCVCLTGGLIYRHTQAVWQEESGRKEMEEVQSQMEKKSGDLDLSRQTNSVLRTDLQTAGEELAEIRRQYETLSNDLSQTREQAEAVVKERQAALGEVSDKEQKIRELSRERQDLSDRIATLNGLMRELEGRLSATESELADSQKDREYLLEEFKRLYAEKRAIEDQFNNQAALQSQQNKLRKEAISRRVGWIRRNRSAGKRKGAELLVAGFRRTAIQTNYNLNVEINRSGGIQILQPPSTGQDLE